MSKITDFKNIVDSNLEKLDIPQEAKLKLINEVKSGRQITPKKLNYKKLSFVGMPIIAATVAFIVFFTGIFPGSHTKVSAKDLMKDITAQKVETIKLKDEFIRSTADFSVELFKETYTNGTNSLVSPTSVYLALGMTANGADGNTLKEFEILLGKYGVNIADLNSYYNSLSRKLTNVDSGKWNKTGYGFYAF